MHKRPFRTAKELVQPLAAQDSFSPYGKKILISSHLSSMGRLPFRRDELSCVNTSCIRLLSQRLQNTTSIGQILQNVPRVGHIRLPPPQSPMLRAITG